MRSSVVEANRVGARATWWRSRRAGLVAVLAVVVAAAAFAYRFNTLGGSLGGLDNDHFAHLMRTEMLLRGEQPLRDFADFELRGARPSLSYEMSALAQRLGGRNLLSEAYLTVGALALAHAILFVLAFDLSKRFSVALLAAMLAIATGPKLYNYPKVLVLTLAALALRLVVINPSVPRLALAAAITAVALLFRHDYAIYVAVGIVSGLIARHPAEWKATARRVGIYGGLTTLLVLPSTIWIQVYEGVPAYIRSSLNAARTESLRTELDTWPAVELANAFDRQTLLNITYYAFWAVILAGVLVLAWRLFSRPLRLDPIERGTGVGLLALAAIVNFFFLRANLGQRFGDAIVPVALVAAWTTGAAAAIRSRGLRRTVAAVPAVLLIGMIAAVYMPAEISRELETGGLSHSWERTTLRFESAKAELARLPPQTWTDADMQGTLAAARYVAQCTGPDDYLFVAAYAPEIPVFARRRFAGGQATVSLAFYTSEADQRRTLSRLERQSVPIVLADYDGFEEEFSGDYPLLARHVADKYTEVGAIMVEDKPRFRVFVDRNRQPTRTDPILGLPCFQ